MLIMCTNKDGSIGVKTIVSLGVQKSLTGIMEKDM